MSRVYKNLIATCDRYVPSFLRPLWEHEAGRFSFRLPDSTYIISILGMLSTLFYVEELPFFILGPKTIFFWAPAFKWSLVIAGLGDINRPAQSLSLSQCGSLAATGIVWSRYSLVIKPKNYTLFAVNVLVAAINVYQISRIMKHKRTNKAQKT